ncbi:MAG: branched-chain amino acid ABC transporter permease [Muribaculaceae bacterium]|nr:branched-chain amino acid ABC transporter permease [Muribaculaceae bacterium]
MKKQKTMSSATRTNMLTYLGVIIAFVVLQLSQGAMSTTLKGQLVPVCAYVVMALSLNLTVGVMGELSLGHAGFMSVGAFSGAVAAAALRDTIPSAPVRLVLAMVIGAVLAGVVGTLISVPVLRLNGDYLAIVTLAFGQIIKSLVDNLYVGVDARGLHFNFMNPITDLEKGGRMILSGPMGINITKISTFLAGFVLILITLAVIFNLVNSRAGRAIMAIRDNRIAAESVGLNITKYKMMAFVISAALAGAAGALFALGQNKIVASKFDFNTSILILVYVVLGGLGNMWGSIIAAAFLTVLPETAAMRDLQDYRMLIYAIILIVVMIATNNATVMRLLSSFGDKVKGLFRKKPAAAQEGGAQQ